MRLGTRVDLARVLICWGGSRTTFMGEEEGKSSSATYGFARVASPKHFD